MSVVLSPEAARVLGCLMEKAATTPDHYPLSVNAIVAACNQTTNREPVVIYDEPTVEHALDELREADLARRIRATGQRVVKHRHVVDERLGLAGPERAVLGVLLLRGEQTPGELKARTERWHGFRSTADVEAALERLADGGLAVRRERRPGQKEARWVTPVIGDIGSAGAAAAAGPAPSA
ncbi:MAG: YceH family protein, partial [Actinomycetota bacterium]